jgi:hypothetical protein
MLKSLCFLFSFEGASSLREKCKVKREKCKIKFYSLPFKLFPFKLFEFKIPGGYGEGEPPVPIPNTAVKPLCADGTCRATGWESKSLPGVFFLKVHFI